MESRKELEQALQIERKREQELIGRLIDLDAQIKKAELDTKRVNKQTKDIYRSKTWKFTAPLRKLLPKPSNFHKLQENTQPIHEVKEALHRVQRDIKLIELQLDRHNTRNLIRYINQVRKDGKLLEQIDELVKAKKISDEFFRHGFKYFASLYKSENADYKRVVNQKVLSALSPKDVPEVVIRSGQESQGISLEQLASFQLSLNLRAREQQVSNGLPEWILDDKQEAYRFMKQIGVRVPWASQEILSTNNFPQKEGVVLKPIDGAGSRGVYLIYDESHIFDVKRSVEFSNWKALSESMKQDIQSGAVAEDKWFMEELIFENNLEKIPARDVKFYCFYGKIGLILEITRYPELRYCWWDGTGERVRTGKYDDNLFKGKGVTPKEIALANKISEKIPVPFIRIDFLRSENELVFGEFTPKPGNYDEFNEETDQRLGDYYLEAQSRLMNDLINGKEFKEFSDLRRNRSSS